MLRNSEEQLKDQNDMTTAMPSKVRTYHQFGTNSRIQGSNNNHDLDATLVRVQNSQNTKRINMKSRSKVTRLTYLNNKDKMASNHKKSTRIYLQSVNQLAFKPNKQNSTGKLPPEAIQIETSIRNSKRKADWTN